jgi:hypothetical protein
LKIPSETQNKKALEAYNSGGTKALETYLASIDDTEYDVQAIADYAVSYGESWVSDYDELSDWTISTDTTNGGWFFGTNWFGGKNTEDHNDEYTKGESEAMTYDDLKKKINASNMPQEKKDELLNALRGQSKK